MSESTGTTARRVSHVFLDALAAIEDAEDPAADDESITLAFEHLWTVGAIKAVHEDCDKPFQMDATALCGGALEVMYWLATTLATEAGLDLADVIASARQKVLDRQADHGEEQPWA